MAYRAVLYITVLTKPALNKLAATETLDDMVQPQDVMVCWLCWFNDDLFKDSSDLLAALSTTQHRAAISSNIQLEAGR